MFKLTQKLRSICLISPTYPNLKKEYLLHLIDNYNTFLCSELEKTNCDIQKFFINQDLNNIVNIENKINLNNLNEEDINKNIKFVSNKFNLVQFKYNLNTI